MTGMGAADSPGAASSTCPVCGRNNRCGIAAGGTTCWCFGETVDAGLVEWLQQRHLPAHCLCRACAAGHVPSPCVGVCMVDDDTGACVGCERTIDEITDWHRRTATERAAVWLRLRQVARPA